MARESSATTTYNGNEPTVHSPPKSTLTQTADPGVVEIKRRPQGDVSRATIESPVIQSVSEARATSRALARAVSEAEVSELMAEHGTLVDKKFEDGTLSSRDRARLAYVRWQIDRIEDANIGEQLDLLEHLTELHESISAEVADFANQVRAVSRPPRKGGKT